MSEREDRVTADRRSFLKLAGLGTVAGGAVLTLRAPAAEATEQAASGSGYRESEHVRTFYETAMF